MKHLRCMVARWLRRLADRLDPQRNMRVRVVGGHHGGTNDACAERVRVTSDSGSIAYTPPPHGYQGP